MNRIRRLLVTCVSLLVLTLDQSASAQVTPRPDLVNTIVKARETAWKAITSGQGSGVTVAIMENDALQVTIDESRRKLMLTTMAGRSH